MLSLSSTMRRFVKLRALFAFEFITGPLWLLTVRSGDFCGPHDNWNNFEFLWRICLWAICALAGSTQDSKFLHCQTFCRTVSWSSPIIFAFIEPSFASICCIKLTCFRRPTTPTTRWLSPHRHKFEWITRLSRRGRQIRRSTHSEPPLPCVFSLCKPSFGFRGISAHHSTHSSLAKVLSSVTNALGSFGRGKLRHLLFFQGGLRNL